ncbi:uncharacterized protein LOC128219088 isoform X2 [Mya arenaria]|uniref:uncharacterized protein LOC128219088 isoform X2 n=1 Tax=Mya arenaria TaxID=6604 RepID=UPI0022E3171C|nr:uncharacterized protein LOC128219088 isoform X2 [Mya arenaria]
MPPEKTRFKLGSEQSEVSQVSTSTVMTDISTDSDETGKPCQPTSASRRPSKDQTPKERETKLAARKRQVSFSNGADETDMSELQRLQSTNSNEIDSVIHQPNYAQQQYYQQHTSYTRVPLDDENMYSLQRKYIERTRRTRRYTEGSICNVDRDFERHLLENDIVMRHSKTAPKLVYPDEISCKCQACDAEHKHREKVISKMENNCTEKNTPRPVLQLTSMSAEKLSEDNTIVWSDKDGQKPVKSNTLKLVDGGKAVQINYGGFYFVSTKLSFMSKKTSIDGESFAIGHQILVDDKTFEETSQMCYFPPTNKTLAVEHVSTKQFVKNFKTYERVSVKVKPRLNFKPESARIILFYLGQSAH